MGHVVAIAFAVLAAAQNDPRVPQTHRYLRPAGTGWTLECTFKIERTAAAWRIDSVTQRGPAKLHLTSQYGPGDALISSKLVLADSERHKMVEVAVKDRTASVRRGANDIREFNIEPGVIVTSAPDWSDVFLLCKRYDHAQAGKQQFPGLWIHPDQPTLQPTFRIQRQGFDEIVHEKKTLKLARLIIHLRANSAYAAWSRMDGLLVRLIPLPGKGARQGLILDGYETSSAVDLQPDGTPKTPGPRGAP